MSEFDRDTWIELYSRIRTALTCGRPLPEELRALGAPDGRPLERLAYRVAGRLENGDSLSAALGDISGVSELDLTLLHSGEAGGDLEEALEALLRHHRSCRRLQRQIAAVTAYPRMVLAIMLIVILPILAWSRSRIWELMGDIDLAPGTLRFSGILHMICNEFTELLLLPYAYGLPGWIAVTAVTSAVLVMRPAPVRRLGWFLLTRFGPLLNAEKHRLAGTLASALGLLLGRGVPLDVALDQVQRFTDDEPSRDALRRIYARVTQGQTLSRAVAPESCYPDDLTWFVGMAERSKELGAGLQRVGEHYENEADSRLAARATLLEPALIIYLGVLVGPMVYTTFNSLLTMMRSL